MRIACPQCSTTYQVQETALGKQVRCKKCNEAFAATPINESTSPSSSTANKTAASPPARSAKPAGPAATNPVSAKPAVAKAPIAQQATRQTAQQPTNSLLSKWDALSDEQKLSVVMRSYCGEFPKPRTAFSYKLGLLFATFFMALIPVIYLGIIVLVGYGVYWHTVSNTGIFSQARGRGAALAFILYVCPIVIGTVLVIFLAKPFIARRGKQGRIRSLTREGEPLLFAHVERICQEVGAPIPRRIDIMNEVNAAAGFRNGFWSMVRGNDLVLHIGMPLVAGLSLQQFTGVLAHEFGHFSQGAGMRLSRLLMMVAEWLRRAVYDRDAWDEWLEGASQSIDIRIGFILYLARFSIWVSRRVLWCLMYIGYVLVGYILKQMEYDADRYEAGMVGKKTFAETSHKMRILGIGYQQSLGTLGRISNEGKLVRNFPKLAQFHSEKLKPEVHKKLKEIYQEEKSIWYESHPCDRDRVNAVDSYPEKGRFQSDLPARVLFRHFDAECEGVTKDFYEEAMGKRLGQLKIVPTNEVIDDESFQDQAWDSLEHFFLGAASPRRNFVMPYYQVFAPESLEKGVALLQRSRGMVEATAPHYITIHDLKEQEETRRRRKDHYDTMKRKMSNVDASILELEELDRSKHIASPDPKQAETFLKAAMIRLHTACCLLQCPEVGSRVKDDFFVRCQIEKVLPVLQTLDNDLQSVIEFSHRFSYFVYIFAHFERMKGDTSMLVREALSASELLVESMRRFRASWYHLPYPFDHAKKDVTVGEQITPEILDHEDVASVASAAEALIDGFHALRGRCLAYLVVAAQSVEDALGLPPIRLKSEANE
jgi:predicted Zn finger-like uncharacterized protein